MSSLRKISEGLPFTSDLGSAPELEPLYSKVMRSLNPPPPRHFLSSLAFAVKRTHNINHKTSWKMNAIIIPSYSLPCIKVCSFNVAFKSCQFTSHSDGFLLLQHNSVLFLLPGMPFSMLPTCYVLCWDPESKLWDPCAFSFLHIQREGISPCIQFELKYINESLPIRLSSCSWQVLSKWLE